MLLQNKQDGTLVKVLDIEALISPIHNDVPGRIQSGQEEQDPQDFSKQEVVFPSGENLPQCWLNPDYKVD
jgi:hypothetical protein